MSDELVLHRGVGKPVKCRSCKAAIVFAETLGGKLAPFQLDEGGNYTMENGVAKFIGKPDAQLQLGELAPVRYSSHFSSCKDAAKWRSKEKK